MNQSTQPPRTVRDDARQAIDVCAAWHSRIAARRITQFLERRMAHSGLSIAQFGLMAQIATVADDTLGALAERLGFEQSSLSRNLHALERDGLVEIAAIERDQRKRAVWLTEAGVRRLAAALPVWRAAHAQLAQRLPPELARQLAEAAEALAED